LFAISPDVAELLAVVALVRAFSSLSLHQLAVTACWCGSSVSLLWAVLVRVSAHATQTAERLFAICPDVAELLAVVAPGNSILGSISFHPDRNVAEA
jgi:hypothetical protein